MADTLVARVTGRDPVDEPVPVQVELVMTDAALLGAGETTAGAAGEEAATVRSRGMVPVPVPASVARALVARAGAAERAWVRRLFTCPDRSALVAMDSRARGFPRALARLIALGDQTCRTPWCDAPVVETDHVEPHADGGRTEADNAQGLCRRCNLAKQAPGWSARRDRDGTVRTTTPTAHTYASVPPPILGLPPSGAGGGRDDLAPVIELHFAEARWHRRRTAGAG